MFNKIRRTNKKVYIPSDTDKCYIPLGDDAGKILLTEKGLKMIAGYLLDVKMDEAEKFLYGLPLLVKARLIPLIIEEYHKRCAKG